MILKRGLYIDRAPVATLAKGAAMAESWRATHSGNGMRYGSIEAFLSEGQPALSKGPVAVIFAEDAIEVDTTLRHHLAAGFVEVLLLAHPDLALSSPEVAAVHRIDHDVYAEGALPDAMNLLIAAAPASGSTTASTRIPVPPFCETRNIREMIAFHAEERRDAVLSYVIDLYADDLDVFRWPSRWRTRISTVRATTHSRGRTPRTTIIQRNGNWISSAACAGALKSMCRPRGGGSTGSRCSGRGRD